jgi:Ni,Fe-hydrogenase I large subunit
VQDRVRRLVESRQLSLFTSGYWGHPAYKLPPEANLMAVAHYLEALEFQREFIKIHAVLGGKNPHLQSFLVGGMTVSMDPNTPQAPLNPERFDFILGVAQTAKTFVDQVLIPDVLAVAGFYPEWFSLGAGPGNYLTYGGFPKGSINDPASYFFPRGLILNNDLSKVHPVDPSKVAEYVTHSWYEYTEGDEVSKSPAVGETKPKYTGPKPPYEFLEVEQKYSWLKAPRYDDQVVEVGPLARMLVAYASGHQEVKSMVDGVLAKFNAQPTALFSTLGRIAARALETQLLARHLPEWIEELRGRMNSGDLRMHNGEKWNPSTWPKSARGYGLFDAPRGSLGHWIEIEDQLIKNYQAVVPSTWNAGPRDAKGQRGPYETSLLKTPVADPERPLEILRTIHSFDPCLACAVHVTDGRGRTYTRRNVPAH